MASFEPKALATLPLVALALAGLAWGCSGGGSGNGDGSSRDASAGDDAGGDATTGGDAATDAEGAPGDGPAADVSSATDAAATADSPIGDAGVTDGGWVLTWSDEFNTGTAPNPAYWTFTSLDTTTSGPGWGQEYDAPGAVTVENGLLTITATQGADGGITSGALDTKGKFQQTYGRFEARMKAPPGAGVWPAFWLMGDTNGQGWPTCGEIDIVEIVGSAPKNAYGTVHSGNTTNASQNTSTGGVYTSSSADMSADFHVYAVEWSASQIDFYVDADLYETITPSTLTSGQLWAFDHAFYVIFDLAIGGSWAGPPTASTFPAPMQVDYVRVYQKP
jgi:beta-glucanase (GH16 family)